MLRDLISLASVVSFVVTLNLYLPSLAHLGR